LRFEAGEHRLAGHFVCVCEVSELFELFEFFAEIVADALLELICSLFTRGAGALLSAAFGMFTNSSEPNTVIFPALKQ
jgi:hypothetical protein